MADDWRLGQFWGGEAGGAGRGGRASGEPGYPAASSLSPGLIPGPGPAPTPGAVPGDTRPPRHANAARRKRSSWLEGAQLGFEASAPETPIGWRLGKDPVTDVNVLHLHPPAASSTSNVLAPVQPSFIWISAFAYFRKVVCVIRRGRRRYYINKQKQGCLFYFINPGKHWACCCDTAP